MAYVLRLLAVILALTLPIPGYAQQDETSTQGVTTLTSTDYSRWESVASRAENAVDSGTDTNAVFETLRLRMVGFRADFDEVLATFDRFSPHLTDFRQCFVLDRGDDATKMV